MCDMSWKKKMALFILWRVLLFFNIFAVISNLWLFLAVSFEIQVKIFNMHLFIWLHQLSAADCGVCSRQHLWLPFSGFSLAVACRLGCLAARGILVPGQGSSLSPWHCKASA